MGYSFYIGGISIEVDEDDDDLNSALRVPLVHDPSAPGEVALERVNNLSVSYTTFDEFTTRVRLRELFFGESGLIPDPMPGIRRLRPEHLAAMRAALDAYRAKHPRVRAAYGTVEGADLLRLEWLVFWCSHALEHHEPAAFGVW